VKAEELLRRYLEQRREMGETELVLDGLNPRAPAAKRTIPR
jgi:hypothetical protein